MARNKSKISHKQSQTSDVIQDSLGVGQMVEISVQLLLLILLLLARKFPRENRQRGRKLVKGLTKLGETLFIYDKYQVKLAYIK